MRSLLHGFSVCHQTERNLWILPFQFGGVIVHNETEKNRKTLLSQTCSDCCCSHIIIWNLSRTSAPTNYFESPEIMTHQRRVNEYVKKREKERMKKKKNTRITTTTATNITLCMFVLVYMWFIFDTDDGLKWVNKLRVFLLSTNM